MGQIDWLVNRNTVCLLNELYKLTQLQREHDYTLS